MIPADIFALCFTGKMMRKKKKKNAAILDMAEKYRGSATPECQYFGRCGGCMFQDINYDQQLLLKQELMQSVFSGLLEVTPLVAAPSPYGYRNRMDYVTSFGKKGLREQGSFKFVVDIEDCPLLQIKSRELWKAMRTFSASLDDYNYLTHEGFLRYIVLREAFYTGETMASLVINGNALPADTAFPGSLPLTSFNLLKNDAITDSSYAPVVSSNLSPSITEKFGDISFKILPNSFFQSNSAVALEVYRIIRDYVTGDTLDLYCGVGSIGLFCANSCDSVTGIEINEEACKAAEENTKLNNLSNVSIHCADAADLDPNMKKFKTVILDPPRSGLHPKLYKIMDSLAPDRIIYMSCNPATFKNDLVAFENYSLDYFKVFDMFPQTPHCESLAILNRKSCYARV